MDRNNDIGSSGDSVGSPSGSAEELRSRFIRERGYWSKVWDQLLAEDPGFFEAYLNYSSEPFREAVLPRKVQELVLIAVDACTTHLFAPGARIHIRNAFEAGATKAEILEVLELVSLVGIHSVAVGLPILLEESEKLEGKRQTQEGMQG